MNVSTIPAPVAAELSGFGSFFGSCQIAAGGFESFLQTASEMPADYEAEMPAMADEGLFASMDEASVSDAISIFSANYNSNEVLKRLQEILGEETGAKVFKIMTDFLKEYKPLEQGGIANSKAAPENMTIQHIMKFLDPEYIAEIPIAQLKAELGDILEEIKAILGQGLIEQPEIEAVQSEIEAVQPETEVAQPEAEIEMPQPKIEAAQPETEVVQPKTEVVQPEAEIPQPKTESVLETAQPETVQPETAQTETETEEEKIPLVKIPQMPLKLYDFTRLSRQMGMEIEEYQKYFEFMHDLLKQGLIDFEEFDEAVDPRSKEPKFFAETLKELWECAKNGDEPKKEEILLMLKQISETKETAKEWKNASSGEQKTNSEIPETPEIPEIPKTSKTPKTSETSEKEGDPKFVNYEPVKNKTGKQREEKQVQPEVRAVWESSGLKIEVINPKTGEKLQSTQTAMPQNMQEKMQEFEVIKQVVARAKFLTTPTGEQRLTIHLRPEHLGQLDLRITLNRGEMQIHARVESTTAQQALENHIGLLREGLEKQGITLERLEISIEQKDRQDAWSLAEKHERQEQKHGQRRNHRGRESHLAVSIANEKADTGRRLGYNTMEYLA